MSKYDSLFKGITDEQIERARQNKFVSRFGDFTLRDKDGNDVTHKFIKPKEDIKMENK